MRTVAFYSRKMTGPKLNYDIHDKELLTVVEALHEWRVYLEGTKYPIQIYTDHKNLLYWTSTKQLNQRQIRWAETLASYSFKINHVQGTENGRADTLSHRSDYVEGSKLGAVSLLQWEGNSLIYQKPANEILAHVEIQLTDQQKTDVIRDRYNHKMIGYQGINKTIELITRDFTWPGLRKTVTDYVNNYDICARAKHSRHKPYRKLQTPTLPEQAWSLIALDFIIKLPTSKEPLTGTTYDSILVIIDTLTKYTYLESYKEASTAEDLAYIFNKIVIARHGIPDKIVLDRDKLFTSQFWQSLIDQIGTKQRLSISYHPQTDGQTERTNQTIEQYLRYYLNYKQNNWVFLLPIAQFTFNNSVAITGISPFFVNYGKYPSIEKTPKGVKPLLEKAHISI